MFGGSLSCLPLALFAALLASGCGGGALTEDARGGDPDDGAGHGGQGGASDGENSNDDDPSDGAPVPGGEGGAAACRVEIRPLSVPALGNVPAGPGKTLTVQAVLTGFNVPDAPSFLWVVLKQGQAFAPEGGDDPAVISFPIEDPGEYVIHAAAGDCEPAEVRAFAVDPSQRVGFYWLRVIPPASQGLLPTEKAVSVLAARAHEEDLMLERGVEVTIDPRRPSAPQLATAVSSYLRLTSEGSSFWQEGRTSLAGGPFVAKLRPAIAYALLVVPDNGWAPRTYDGLFAGLAANTTELRSRDINTVPFDLEPGVRVAGKARVGETEVIGARILLRSGRLPSTLGTSADGGAFELFASGEDTGRRFGVQVSPPEGTRLPALELAEAAGIDVPARSDETLGLDVAWSDLPRTPLTLVVRTATLRPAALARVRLSTKAPIANAGQLLRAGGKADALTGNIDLDLRSDTTGKVSITDLPRALYQVSVTALDTSASLHTTIDTRNGEGGELTLTLPRRIMVTGSVGPTARAAGATIAAIATDDLAAPALSTTADDTGHFQLALDPAREYRLRARLPGPEGRWVPLGSFVSGTTSQSLPMRVLPDALLITGRVRGAGAVVPGAIVQAYCLLDIPDCVKFRAPSVDGVLLLGEAVADPQGRYQIAVSDPGSE